MNTRLLMIASALVLATIGLSLTFAPEEVFAALGGGTSGPWTIVLQLGGALYCGFALMNWMAKGAVLGGIYGRPLVIGNLVHFTIGGLALLKAGSGTLLWTVTAAYVLFAALFGYVMFTHPVKSD
ncbi:MAG TPA: hypothetical protein VKG92_07095, partial [Flavobacteriales bacterium]|nr:hypothetical protein [Flavobacteriales bacterium]